MNAKDVKCPICGTVNRSLDLDEILPMMLLLGCWGTLLLGPVVSLRYALPLIYCVPRLLEMIVGLTGKR